MTLRTRSLPWRRLAPVGVAAALLFPAAPGAGAAGPDQAGGQWTAPFEEGGAGVPRCAPRKTGAASSSASPRDSYASPTG